MKLKQTFTAAVFLFLLAAGLWTVSVGTLHSGQGRALLAAAHEADGVSAGVRLVIDGAEGAVNRDLDGEHLFIQCFGALQRLLGRRVVQDADASSTVVKLDSGALQFVDLHAGYYDATEHAMALADFSDRLAERGLPLLYVNAPQKIQRGTSPLPDGVAEYGNEMGDRLLEVLEQRGVAAFDLRDAFDATQDYPSWFFTTDHHWKPSAAFFAYQTLAPILSGYGIETEPRYLDRASYRVAVYENWFLGSQGKRVGSFYAGTDDFEWWEPTQAGSFTCDVDAYGIHRTGGWNESLLFPERMETRDWFSGNPYTLYSGGDYPLATITNHDNPDGGDIVLLRDSFACALTPFLALSCHTLTTIDLRYFDGSLEDTVAALDPDLVMVLYCTSTAKQDAMFSF